MIASAISSNQSAIFVPCDHMLNVYDVAYSVYAAPGSLSHVYIALGPRARGNVKFCYYPELSCCSVKVLFY